MIALRQILGLYVKLVAGCAEGIIGNIQKHGGLMKKRNHFKFKPGRDKLYMQRFFDLDRLTPKQYNYCQKILRSEEAKATLGAHKISILRVVMLKMNSPKTNNNYPAHEEVVTGSRNRHVRHAF